MTSPYKFTKMIPLLKKQNIWWKSDQQIFTSYEGDVCFDVMVGNRFKHAKDHMLVGYFMRIGVVPDMGT